MSDDNDNRLVQYNILQDDSSHHVIEVLTSDEIRQGSPFPKRRRLTSELSLIDSRFYSGDSSSEQIRLPNRHQLSTIRCFNNNTAFTFDNVHKYFTSRNVGSLQFKPSVKIEIVNEVTRFPKLTSKPFSLPKPDLEKKFQSRSVSCLIQDQDRKGTTLPSTTEENKCKAKTYQLIRKSTTILHQTLTKLVDNETSLNNLENNSNDSFPSASTLRNLFHEHETNDNDIPDDDDSADDEEEETPSARESLEKMFNDKTCILTYENINAFNQSTTSVGSLNLFSTADNGIEKESFHTTENNNYENQNGSQSFIETNFNHDVFPKEEISTGSLKEVVVIRNSRKILCAQKNLKRPTWTTEVSSINLPEAECLNFTEIIEEPVQQNLKSYSSVCLDGNLNRELPFYDDIVPSIASSYKFEPTLIELEENENEYVVEEGENYYDNVADENDEDEEAWEIQGEVTEEFIQEIDQEIVNSPSNISVEINSNSQDPSGSEPDYDFMESSSEQQNPLDISKSDWEAEEKISSESSIYKAQLSQENLLKQSSSSLEYIFINKHFNLSVCEPTENDDNDNNHNNETRPNSFASINSNEDQFGFLIEHFDLNENYVPFKNTCDFFASDLNINENVSTESYITEYFDDEDDDEENDNYSSRLIINEDQNIVNCADNDSVEIEKPNDFNLKHSEPGINLSHNESDSNVNFQIAASSSKFQGFLKVMNQKWVNVKKSITAFKKLSSENLAILKKSFDKKLARATVSPLILNNVNDEETIHSSKLFNTTISTSSSQNGQKKYQRAPIMRFDKIQLENSRKRASLVRQVFVRKNNESQTHDSSELQTEDNNSLESKQFQRKRYSTRLVQLENFRTNTNEFGRKRGADVRKMLIRSD